MSLEEQNIKIQVPNTFRENKGDDEVLIEDPNQPADKKQDLN